MFTQDSSLEKALALIPGLLFESVGDRARPIPITTQDIWMAAAAFSGTDNPIQAQSQAEIIVRAQELGLLFEDRPQMICG